MKRIKMEQCTIGGATQPPSTLMAGEEEQRQRRLARLGGAFARRRDGAEKLRRAVAVAQCREPLETKT